MAFIYHIISNHWLSTLLSMSLPNCLLLASRMSRSFHFLELFTGYYIFQECWLGFSAWLGSFHPLVMLKIRKITPADSSNLYPFFSVPITCSLLNSFFNFVGTYSLILVFILYFLTLNLPKGRNNLSTTIE